MDAMNKYYLRVSGLSPDFLGSTAASEANYPSSIARINLKKYKP